MKRIHESLAHLRAQGNIRRLENHQDLADFSSNDYLGLAESPYVRAQLQKALCDLDLGSRGSRLLSGNTVHHVRVESFLADTFRAESALLMSSGYAANVGLLQALGDEQTHYFSDSLNHASLIDGMRLSHAQRSVFRHNDLEDLERQLSRSKSDRRIIVTESVFSMDGDLAPLSDLIPLAQKYEAWLLVDEAHATGIFGEHGLGRIDHSKKDQPTLITLHTASKALGCQGAFILAPEIVKQYLINKSRSFIYSTALSPILVIQIQIAVREMLKLNANHAGEQILMTAQRIRQELGLRFDFGRSESQIIPILLGSNIRSSAFAKALQSKGFDVRAIRSPTVPLGRARVRLTVKRTNSTAEINHLVSTIREIAE